jgi:hypothetical protein
MNCEHRLAEGGANAQPAVFAQRLFEAVSIAAVQVDNLQHAIALHVQPSDRTAKFIHALEVRRMPF